MTASTIFTIGHSTHTYEYFLSLLRRIGVNAIADVRSSPYSRHFPHFNSTVLKNELRYDGIAYSYLGEELGGRPENPELFTDSIADYEKMAQARLFQIGLKRVLTGALKFNIALMCSEQNPLDCHRCLLVGRALKWRGSDVRHITGAGEVLTHENIEENLLQLSSSNKGDLFLSEPERLKIAYRERAFKVAYSEKVIGVHDE